MRKVGHIWLPENETPTHWALKWCGWWLLRHHFKCFMAGVEMSVYRGRGRGKYAVHDAVGFRHEYRYRKVETMTVRPEHLRVYKGLEPDPYYPGRYRSVYEPWKPGVQGEGIFLEDDWGRTATVDVLEQTALGDVRVRVRGSLRTEVRMVYAVDAKQSRSDYQAWLREWEGRTEDVDYAIIIAPAGLLTKDDLPPKVGLAEVDPDNLLDDLRDEWKDTLEWYQRQGRQPPAWYRRPGLYPQVNVVREPSRLRKAEEMPDAVWYRLQSECVSSLGHLIEDTLADVFWLAVSEAVKGTVEVVER